MELGPLYFIHRIEAISYCLGGLLNYNTKAYRSSPFFSLASLLWELLTVGCGLVYTFPHISWLCSVLPALQLEGKSNWLWKTVVSLCRGDFSGSGFQGQQGLNGNSSPWPQCTEPGQRGGQHEKGLRGVSGGSGQAAATWLGLESWARFFQGVKTEKTFLREGVACTKHGSPRETWVLRAIVSRFLWLESGCLGKGDAAGGQRLCRLCSFLQGLNQQDAQS